MVLSIWKQFPALHIKNYRLYWIGSVLSNNGRWVQYIATYYIIFQLTGSAAWVGFAGFANFIPMLIVNPLAGWISDNLYRRQVLWAGNVFAAVCSGIMALFWISGLRSPISWVGLLFINGAITGLLIPVGQAFVAECVPYRHLRNAITLNSTQFNAARALGPGIGGLLLGVFGPGVTLASVAIFYMPIVYLLIQIDLSRGHRISENKNSLKIRESKIIADYRTSIRYVRSVPGIVSAILMVAFISALAMPVVQQVVVFAEEVFEVSPFLFGLLGSAQGIGAVISAPMAVGFVARCKPSNQQFFATLGYGIAITSFALAPTYFVAFLALIVVGFTHLISAANLNSVVQLQVDDSKRGRVMAIYLIGVLGPAPFANLALGWLISVFGPRLVVAICGGLLGFAALVFRFSGYLQRLDR